MPIELDHCLVPARDRRAAAQLLAELLGVPWAEEGGAGPFSAVYVNDGLTLDFDSCDGVPPQLHHAFRVDDARFDALLGRFRQRGIAWRSTPHGPVDRQVNTAHGGRIVYWDQPDGHVWEALTLSCARRGAAGAS